MPQVVTANHLLEGDVIYLTTDRTWTRHLTEAAPVTGDDADALLAFAEAQAGSVVGAYLAEVELVDGKPAPTHFREAFRTRGPSNYFHGKQAESADV